MTIIHIDVSMDQELLRQVDEIAQELNITRSRLAVLALQDYLRRREGQRITDQLNAVYGEDYELDEEDKAFLRAGKRSLRKILEAEGDEW